ncbi:MAG: UDP-3-O-(3-hydroxymyristoyl)glucosamine N-acyltransferase [Planctomycetes bacterium]|nr:UDP-3-O-(3-hydroxymyristoyl)glucosamine N-acyltransferase [Planctomycetota bacterium]
MRVTVKQIAELLGGQVIGDETTAITGVSSLTEASPGDISFLANPKYAPYLAETKASAVLVAAAQPGGQLVQVVVANPDQAFARLVDTYGPQVAKMPPGVHPTAVIGENVRLGRDVTIAPYVVLADGAVVGDRSVIYPHVYLGADSRVGNDCVIYPHVSIRERCTLGDRVIIHSGTVIGSDGFGYATVEGIHHKIQQVGQVVIEDDVEIGACTTIDRARFDKTRIGKGTKIDNLVQIAHNVQTGSHCLIVAQVGIAGSTKLGNHVTLGGQAAINGHIVIGDQAIVTAMAGVSKSVPPKTVVRGYPAQEIKVAQAQEVAVRRLPKTQQTVRQLEARIADLEARITELAKAKP